MAYRDNRLQCEVLRLNYDFSTGLGILHFPEDNCCDMGAAIKLFTDIDKNSTTIITYSGDKEDTIYRRKGDKWESN